MTSFMAECFWPGVTRLLLNDAGRRAGQAAQGFSSNGASTRYVGSILVPADEIALCLFEAPSIDAATELNERAAIPFERRRAAIPCERVVEVVQFGARTHVATLPDSHERRGVDERS